LWCSLLGNSKSTLTHYAGDYATYVNTVAEQKIAQMRLRVAYEKERDKLKEFISREGKKYDNPAHQAQVLTKKLLWLKEWWSSGSSIYTGLYLCIHW
jgi:ATPase subunit of ABC transporter with duplicated ATPase domains